jgi:hypothetical protein
MVCLAGAAAIAIGCFLPWAKVQFIGTITISGTDGEDWILFIIGAALIALVAWQNKAAGVILALSLLGVVGFFVEYNDIKSRSDEAEISVTIGIGLWLILAGSVAGVIGAVQMLNQRKSTVGSAT